MFQLLCFVLITVDNYSPAGGQAPAHHMMLEVDVWRVADLIPTSCEVVKTDNRSGILFSECWLLCSLLLEVSTSPHGDARGGWVVSRGPGARFLKMMSR